MKARKERILIDQQEHRRIKLVTEYRGTRYAGWQYQDNAPTVQAALEKALSELLKRPVKLIGCSRTDAGVHALNHVSHFNGACPVPLDKFPLALIPFLPADIAVKEAQEVDEDFHARFSAKGKSYFYQIWNMPYRSALLSPYSYHEPRHLDLEAMKEACPYFIGTHDFAGFMATGSQAKTTVRTIYDLHIEIPQDGLIQIRIHGDAFLYNMVRIIAGTLLYVGLGKIKLSEIEAIIASKDRKKAGKTLEAKGLFLERVYY
jgi:tRNA pseudouridine38-40 synthase